MRGRPWLGPRPRSAAGVPVTPARARPPPNRPPARVDGARPPASGAPRPRAGSPRRRSAAGGRAHRGTPSPPPAPAMTTPPPPGPAAAVAPRRVVVEYGGLPVAAWLPRLDSPAALPELLQGLLVHARGGGAPGAPRECLDEGREIRHGRSGALGAGPSLSAWPPASAADYGYRRAAEAAPARTTHFFSLASSPSRNGPFRRRRGRTGHFHGPRAGVVIGGEVQQPRQGAWRRRPTARAHCPSPPQPFRP